MTDEKDDDVAIEGPFSDAHIPTVDRKELLRDIDAELAKMKALNSVGFEGLPESIRSLDAAELHAEITDLLNNMDNIEIDIDPDEDFDFY